VNLLGLWITVAALVYLVAFLAVGAWRAPERFDERLNGLRSPSRQSQRRAGQ
jgi:hypothetical protein